MAVSIANILTSRLWKGEPKIVIRGKFLLGLTAQAGSNEPLCLAPFLYLDNGFAQNSEILGDEFTVQVEGRQPRYASGHDSYVSPGLHGFDSWSSWVAQNWGSPSSVTDVAENPYYYPVYVNTAAATESAPEGMALKPCVYEGLYPMARVYDGWYNFSSESEAVQHYGRGSGPSVFSVQYAYVGIDGLVSNEVKITLRGVVRQMDLTKLMTAGFRLNGAGAPADLRPVRHAGSAWPLWQFTDVRIYDSPWLRGNVTTGGVQVKWE